MAKMTSNSIYETHSNPISFSKDFCITHSENSEPCSGVIFTSPDKVTLSNELFSSNGFIHFSIKRIDMEYFRSSGLKIQHIAEYIQNYKINSISLSGNNLYVHLAGAYAFIVGSRISDYFLTRVIEFETVEDLLYHIENCFQSLKMNRSEDNLILCGEIDPDSKIVRLLSIYYPNLIANSGLSLSSVISS